MRFTALDADTGGPVRLDLKTLQPGSAPPPPIAIPNTDQHQRVQFMYVPRIRCYDCTTKLYTAVPEDTASKFEVHLTNSKHKQAVAARLNNGRSSHGETS